MENRKLRKNIRNILAEGVCGPLSYKDYVPTLNLQTDTWGIASVTHVYIRDSVKIIE